MCIVVHAIGARVRQLLTMPFDLILFLLMKSRRSEKFGETSHRDRTKSIKHDGHLGNLFFSLKYEDKRWSYFLYFQSRT